MITGLCVKETKTASITVERCRLGLQNFIQKGRNTLHQPVDGEAGILAVGEASDDATKVTVLIGDAHIDIGNLVVVEHLGGLSGKRVAYLGAMEEHDVVLDAEGDAHIDIRYLMMVVNLSGFGRERITNFGTMEEHDVVLNAKGKTTAAVHNGGYRDVGQSKEHASLTDAPCIKMFGGNSQFSCSIAFTHFLEFTATVGSKTVVKGEIFLEGHEC